MILNILFDHNLMDYQNSDQYSNENYNHIYYLYCNIIAYYFEIELIYSFFHEFYNSCTKIVCRFFLRLNIHDIYHIKFLFYLL